MPLIIAIGILALVSATPQPPAAEFPDATATDPKVLAIMQGSPPPPDKVVRFATGAGLQFPLTRWSFSHWRELQPTVNVWRGTGPVSRLPRAARDDIDALWFTTLDGRRMTWRESLAANYTDGIVVLHRGKIVYERYFGALEPQTPHVAMSVTKSVVGTLAAQLAADGRLALDAPVTAYVPELKDSAFGDATVRQVLDMTTNLRYSEVYADPNADVWNYGRACGALPTGPAYQGPDQCYAYLTTVQRAGPHGATFSYKTPNAEVAAWIVKRAAGTSLATLLSELIWQKIGAEQDAYFAIDAVGTEIGGGGLSTTLRDLARFGELIRLHGRFNGRQIVPAVAIAEIRRGADRSLFAAAGYSTLPGWSYHDLWWISHNEDGAFCARGIHGQVLWIDPKAEMVIARFASFPLAANSNLDPTSLPAFAALGNYLMRGSRTRIQLQTQAPAQQSRPST